MRLLHTSDWHLGKRLEGKSRLTEQRDVLEELCRVCDERQVDVVLVSGDVFDSANPPAEAEELFYSTAVQMGLNRCFVAIAGNHDNAERLKAPSDLAKACNILLLGDLAGAKYTGQKSYGGKVKITGGEGFVRIEKGGETLNLAFLPYPSYSRMSALGYKPQYESYAQDVKSWVDKCTECFTDGGLNVFASHLYMLGCAKSDETELGSAVLLPTSVLPSKACYTALGHIHKPQKVSALYNAYYSGSILKYSFDDTSAKFFNLVTLTGKAKAEVEKIPIASGKTPILVTVKSYDEGLAALQKNADNWVRLLYDCSEPLTGVKYSALRACENFCGLENIFVRLKQTSGTPNARRSDQALFVDFFKREKGTEPPQELIDLFLSAVQGEEI